MENAVYIFQNLIPKDFLNTGFILMLIRNYPHYNTLILLKNKEKSEYYYTI